MIDEQKRLIDELAKQGKSDPQIARIIGIGRCTIGSIAGRQVLSLL